MDPDGYDEQDLAAARRAPSKSFLKKLSGGVAAHPNIAIAIIVVLIAVIVYLFAKSRGWVGASPSSGSRKKRAARRRPPDDFAEDFDGDDADDDDDLEAAIDFVNSS